MMDPKDAEIQRLQAEVASLKAQLQNSKHQQDDNQQHDSGGFSFLSQVGLDKEQVERYSRQALLPQCGPSGTREFLDARAVVIGCGGLGSTAIMFLAASGVGHIVLVDADVVDRSNLHRQIIHTDDRVGMPKVESAKLSAQALNPTIKIDTFNARFSPQNADEIFQQQTEADVVVVVLDCTDNVSARYLINDACVRRGLPLVSGAAMRWDGQLSVYNVPLGGSPSPRINVSKAHQHQPAAAAVSTSNGDGGQQQQQQQQQQEHRSPTYRCMHPTPPPPTGGCNDIGVFGPVPGVIGTLQAVEALKTIIFLAKLRDAEKESKPLPTSDHLLAGRMLVWDAHGGTFRVIKMRPRSDAGVTASTTGELSALGGAFDGCSMEKISEEGFVIDHNAAVNIRTLLHDANGEEQQQQQVERRRQRSRDDNNNSNKKNFQLPAADKIKQLIIIVDVRAAMQVQLCSLDHLYELPHFDADSGRLVWHAALEWSVIDRLSKPVLFDTNEGSSNQKQQQQDLDELLVSKLLPPGLDAQACNTTIPQVVICFLCRRGRDSTRAAVVFEKLKKKANDAAAAAKPFYANAAIQNIRGGLNAWSLEADERFPFY